MTTTPPTRIGKTTVAVCVGSIIAQLRQDGRVVAIDADTSFGKLKARIDPHAVGSYGGLAADDHLDTFSDVRTKVGTNADGLFVLTGETATARQRVLNPTNYRELPRGWIAISRLRSWTAARRSTRRSPRKYCGTSRPHRHRLAGRPAAPMPPPS